MRAPGSSRTEDAPCLITPEQANVERCSPRSPRCCAWSVALLTAQVGAQAATAAASGAAANAKAKPKPYKDASLPIGQRVRDLLGRMTLEEKIGQMTQAERDDVAADPSAITTLKLGSVLSGGGSVPAPNTPTAGPTWSTTTRSQALATRLQHPDHLRRGRGARPRQPQGRDRLPPQHRSRRDPRPGAGREDRRTSPRRRRARPDRVGVRAVHLRGPRRPVGSHLRVVRRGPGAGRARWRRAIDGLQGGHGS